VRAVPTPLSPVLANIFLHYVLDEWFVAEIQPRMRGPSSLVRYADDFVMMLAYKDDAERVLEVLGSGWTSTGCSCTRTSPEWLIVPLMVQTSTF
jgi:hypothetical protein